MVEPRYTKIYFSFGIGELDRSGIDQWNTTFYGKVVMDKKFNLKKERVQTALKDFCRKLEKQSFIVPTTMDCWINKFDTWLRNQENKKIPLEEDQFMGYLNKWINKDTNIGTKDGRRAKRLKHVGIVDGVVKYTEIAA